MVDSSSSADDPLASALERVRLRGSVFGAGELGAPWGVRTRGLPELVCYVVVRGAAFVELLGAPREQLALAGGDVVLVAAGRAHAVKDARRSPTVAFEELQRSASGRPGALRWGGPGPRTTLVCGALALDDVGRHLFGSALPGLLHLPAETAGPALRGVVDALAGEVAAPGPGSAPALTRLAELVFIHALRTCIAGGVAGVGWLRGLGDPSLARALAAIHAEPGAAWTVDSLAARAGMSRSAFAAEFRRCVGATPLAYLTGWRMRLAARRLAEDGGAVKQIAAELGYGSDEAFSRAFRRHHGCPPGAYRRAHAT